MNRLAAAVLLALAASSANAATFVVTRSDDPAPSPCVPGDCSLREAMDAANAAPGGDIVELPTGTFNLTFAAAPSGETTLVPTDHVHIVGKGATSSRIRSTGLGSVFRVSNTALTLEKLSVLHGRTGTLNATGGAIRAEGSKLALIDTVFDDHEAESMGGAIHLIFSTLDMTRSEISGSISGAWGGGIAAFHSRLTMSKGSTIRANSALIGGGIYLFVSHLTADDTSSIRDNSATAAAGVALGGSITGVATRGGGGLFEISNNHTTSGSGGALSLSSSAVVSRVALLDNEASSGGGIMVVSGTPTVRDSLIAANHADEGGGIYVDADATLRLERVSIEGNSAEDQGGALLNIGTTTMSNVDIHGNIAPMRAAIANQEGHVALQHATISGNRAGHAFDALWMGTDATATYANSIMAGNCSGNSAAITAQGRNLRTTSLQGINCPGATASAAQLALTRGLYGGSFEVSGTTNPASVLIDSGAAAHCLPTDVRDAARDSRCDTGAFEYGAFVE